MAMAEALHELNGLEVLLAQWWQVPEAAAILENAFPDPGGSHAEAGETSMILAIRPDVVRLDRAAHNPESPCPEFLTQQVFLEHFPHGVIGPDPKLASAEVGRRALAAAVDAYEQVLEDWKG
jgi:creatinine amidohydrolase